MTSVETLPRADDCGGLRAGLRHAPRVTVALVLVPIGAGLLGRALPAFGWLPGLQASLGALAPWRALWAAPGIGTAVGLTLMSGLSATILAVALVFGCCAHLAHRPPGRLVRGLMGPILAAPHAAMAIGVGFLLAPSGWIVRLLSPWLTGWHQPPDLATVQDPYGIALTVGLLVKEIPYLLLMSFSALGQVPARRQLEVAAALGYARTSAWLKLVLPQLYAQLRLPIYAVLAYSLSVVDMALILGPGNPPTLSVLALRWFSSPHVQLYFPAAAAALLQLGIVATSIAAWRAGEVLIARLARRWIARGARHSVLEPLAALARGVVGGLIVLGAAALLALAVWSVAAAWRFPQVLPQRCSAAVWRQQAGTLLWPLGTTLLVAAAASAAALLLVLACLEQEQRCGAPARSRMLWLLYVPLLVPQIAFLFGTQVLFTVLRLDGTLLAVIWSHLLFVLPYVFLSLGDPWRSLDPRYARTALALGSSPARVFLRVKLPLLLRPVLIAAAVGVAVSVDQYLPTIFAGAGRVVTLTTEAVTLASGGDRRVTGVFAVLQSVLPLTVYGLAVLVPWLKRGPWRARRAS
ncbi:MAG: ABC transporter permease [Steroidobacteraceae bacterium]